MNEWCISRSPGGYVNYSRTHRFIKYYTFFFKNEKFYCKWCGKKITPEEYEEYSKYLLAINKVKK